MPDLRELTGHDDEVDPRIRSVANGRRDRRNSRGIAGPLPPPLALLPFSIPRRDITREIARTGAGGRVGQFAGVHRGSSLRLSSRLECKLRPGETRNRLVRRSLPSLLSSLRVQKKTRGKDPRVSTVDRGLFCGAIISSFLLDSPLVISADITGTVSACPAAMKENSVGKLLAAIRLKTRSEGRAQTDEPY